MLDDKRTERQEQIEAAAYAVLERKGYAGATMAAIAKEARASYETLYKWYGDKTGLFRALVVRNADDVREKLASATERAHPIEVLREVAPLLLNLLLGDRAIGLNRAAAADPSGELGAVIGEKGRETVLPLLGRVLEQARVEGALAFDDTAEAADLFVSLVVGDLQIRRVIGRLDAPNAAFCRERASKAVDRFVHLVRPA